MSDTITLNKDDFDEVFATFKKASLIIRHLNVVISCMGITTYNSIVDQVSTAEEILERYDTLGKDE